MLVRDVLLEPVAMMAKWVDSLPPEGESLTPEAVQAAGDAIQLDLVEFIHAHLNADGTPK
jgi:hypothetical protein